MLPDACLAIGRFGLLMVGLTVFGVITVVNVTVITKGPGRMAGMPAGFALASLPGKQLSICKDPAFRAA